MSVSSISLNGLQAQKKVNIPNQLDKEVYNYQQITHPFKKQQIPRLKHVQEKRIDHYKMHII